MFNATLAAATYEPDFATRSALNPWTLYAKPRPSSPIRASRYKDDRPVVRARTSITWRTAERRHGNLACFEQITKSSGH